MSFQVRWDCPLLNWRPIAVGLILLALLFCCFSGLFLDPSSLIVDAEHPSLDHARPLDDAATGNDLTGLFLPHHLAIARSIRETGHVPLWDDRGFGGRPLVGNPQAGFFYPPVWIAWATGWPACLGWITIAHLLFLGLGTYHLSRTLGVGFRGSIVAAGCVQASPYVLAQTFEGHYPHVWAACWYPWAFQAALRLREGDFARGLLLVPILAASFFAGHPQEWYYLVIALGFWALWDALAKIRSRCLIENVASWAYLSALLTVTLGLMAIELIPDMMAQEWTLKGTRLNLRMASRYHVYPLNWIQLLSPTALGGPADYFGHENFWESVLSIGLIPLVLAVIGVAWSFRRRVCLGWLALVVCAVLFASGRKFGLFPLLYEILPGMDRFRVPARALFVASLGASILAGLGVEALQARASQVTGWGKLARRASGFAILASLLIVTGLWLPGDRSSEISETGRFGLACSHLASNPVFWSAVVVVTLGLLIAWKFPSTRQKVAVALGLLGLAELGFHGHQLIKTTPASRYFEANPISKAIDSARPPHSPPARIRAVDTLYSDLEAGQAGLVKTNINDSFQIQHSADLYEVLYRLFDRIRPVGQGPMDEEVARFRLELSRSVLDRMSVDFLVDNQLEAKPTGMLVESGCWKDSEFAVYRNPTAVPRAYVVPRVELSPEDRSIVSRFRLVDPRRAVLMPFDPIDPAIKDRQEFQPAEWISYTSDRLVVRVENTAAGLLVIADTWMPGWSATVDGKPTPIYRGNRAQRVVPLLEPGPHEVILTYWTPGLTAGLVVSSISAMAWLGLFVAAHRRIRPPAAAGTGREQQPRQ